MTHVLLTVFAQHAVPAHARGSICATLDTKGGSQVPVSVRYADKSGVSQLNETYLCEIPDAPAGFEMTAICAFGARHGMVVIRFCGSDLCPRGAVFNYWSLFRAG